MSRAAALLRAVCAGTVATACSTAAVDPDDRFEAFRADALARAAVFRAPFTPGALDAGARYVEQVTCRFLVTDATGTTPKFDCEMPDGTRVKVKYGSKPEIPGEAAATRLLTALGFGADHVILASRVRCHGCPPLPFHTNRLAEGTYLSGLLQRTRNYDTYRDFEWAAVEYKMKGAAVSSGDRKGWAFFELDAIDAARGGASRAEVDALRLVSVFLAHWDNKPENQRLACMPPDEREGVCADPLVMLQDVGATFGPRKVDLEAWAHTPVWVNPAGCRVSMRQMPHGGGTFTDVEISEAGRRLLSERLSRLTRAQIERLFREARFPGDAGAWVEAFERKAADIASRAGCTG